MVHIYDGRRTVNGFDDIAREPLAPGARARVRVINTDNGPMSVWVGGGPFRLLAVDGHDVNEPGPLEGTSVLVTAGGRADLEVVAPLDGTARRVELGGSTALVLGGDQADAPGGHAPPGAGRRPADVRGPGSAWGGRAGTDAPLRLRDRAAPRLRRRPPGPLVDDQRPPVPGRPDVRGRRGRRGAHADQQLERGRPSDAPARPPCRGPEQERRGRDGQPVVGRLAERRRRRDLRDRLRRRQPRHLDGPLPQPAPCRPRARRAPCLRGGHHAVRPRWWGREPA